MKKQAHGHFPDDCWELIFQKLREDDERDLGSISLVSKRFLSISNQAKLRLNVNDGTLPLLPNLLRRFLHIGTIVIDTNAHKDIDRLLDQISRSGALNLQAIKFRSRLAEPPRDGFKALALNENIKNNLKFETVLSLSFLSFGLFVCKKLALIWDPFSAFHLVCN
ncbi:hypothetical protein RHGRI_000245 [Rhododendron griersonianum]|uniref:F-box domain-containing protein n=1 Tax=Rhododendron griersonianum TaxID=479676 RepID=A0AAV6LGT0_9ERIC|nr:hypothetical protein RHGRI_000245 [Rhododendron griersonianum]